VAAGGGGGRRVNGGGKMAELRRALKVGSTGGNTRSAWGGTRGHPTPEVGQVGHTSNGWLGRLG
jgi:hypothetical protein